MPIATAILNKSQGLKNPPVVIQFTMPHDTMLQGHCLTRP
jgi:hypothetical protein